MKQAEVKIPEDLWDYIVEEGKKIEKGITNKFNKDDILTIIETMDFFQATDLWKKQTYFDLTLPKYRLFDWLAMCVMGRNNDNRKQNNTALKVLVWAWLKTKGIPEDFIADLRETDYQIDTKWEKIKLSEEKE